jgi:RNA polymerase sigma factor (sigma-70 family)
LITNTTHNISIPLLKAKDVKAFEELYDKYSGALYNVILRITNHTEVAQDVLQEGFLKIWRSIDTYDETKASIFTWMLNICRNAAIDANRKAQTRPAIITDTESEFVQDLNSTKTNTDLIGVKNALKYLSTEQSHAIQAVYFSGLTHDEAAAALQIPLGTLKTRIRTSLNILKKVFNH